jgi:putative transposase
MESAEYANMVCETIQGPTSVKAEIKEVILKFHKLGLFTIPGLVKNFEHEIELSDAIPYIAKVYPSNKKTRDIMDDILDDYLIHEIIFPEEELLDWACAPLLVIKKPNTPLPTAVPSYRLCINYKPINKFTKHRRYIMPRIDYILSQLRTAKVFTTIDLSSGYHQIPVKKEHQKYTTFVTPHRGAFKFLRTPFGLSHAGDSFMFCMDKTLQGLTIGIALLLLTMLSFILMTGSHMQNI